ncbi:MAG: phosphate ABC transporter permease subunit PstC [Planctomycetaceae bacterium]|nr:phosphate ABC transporter permease subunit PstC [Planctomycetaceae bacterium]
MNKNTLLLSKREDRLRRIRAWIGGWLLARVANIALLAVIAIFIFITWKSIPFFTQENIFNVLSSPEWHPERADAQFGMLSMIYGSILVTFGAMCIAVPIGVMTAVVLSDMVPFQVRQWIKPIMELLAAIPSVAFGFFAIKVVAPWLQDTFGFPSGTNALNASLVLAIMAIPTIVSVAEDAMTSLGRELREASYALGATRFETLTKVVLPAAHSGILTAIVLGMMRAIGETMVVWMAAGNASNVPTPWYDVQAVLGSFTEAVRTMTATVASDMGETSADSMHRSALFAVGFVLLIFTFCLNLVSEQLSHRFRSKMGESAARSKPAKTITEPETSISYLSYAFRKIGILVRKSLDYAAASVSIPFRWWEHAVHGLIKRLGPRLHLFARNTMDRLFTLAGFASVFCLTGVLFIVLGPLLGNGREAFLFRATVEHRLFLKNQYQRGHLEAVRAEFEQCFAVRKPVYETLDRFAWLAPEPLLEQAARRDRATRQESEQILAQLQHELDVALSEEARANLAQRLEEEESRRREIDNASRRLLRAFNRMCESTDITPGLTPSAPDEILEGTPAYETAIVMQRYFEFAQAVNVELRETPTIADPNKTYGTAFQELRHRITGSDGNGGLLGPEIREGIEHLPPEIRYGTPHWVMTEKYCEAILRTTVWKPQWDEEGNVLPNREVPINRADIFDEPVFAELREMLEYLESNIDRMMNPRWTFYWGYFYDAPTAGYFMGGIGPALLGTLIVTFFAILFAMPIGVATAAYLVETAKEDGVITRTIRLAIDTLAGVPSIVFGLFGLAVIVHYITKKPCILAGSLTLAILVLPVLIRASEEAIRSVPQTFREAALGLGASATRCFFTVTFPAALPGILTGTILAMSRAAGDTASLLFTCAVATGGIVSWTNILFEHTPILSYSAYDIAVGDRLANMVPYNQYGLVATLIILVLTLNLTAIILRGRIARKLRGG